MRLKKEYSYTSAPPLYLHGRTLPLITQNWGTGFCRNVRIEFHYKRNRIVFIHCCTVILLVKIMHIRMLSCTHLVDGNTIAACQYRRLWKLEATVNCINRRSTTCFVLPKSVLWVSSYLLLCFIIAVNSSLAIFTFRNVVDKLSFKMSHVDLIQ
jgi:hypothetical protein